MTEEERETELLFFRAIRSGDLDEVKRILALIGRLPSSAICSAADDGQLEVLSFLLSQKAWKIDRDELDAGLGYASWQNGVAVATKLIEAGANVDSQLFDHKRTPLIEAAERGHLEMVRLLCDRGANLDLVDESVETRVLGGSGGHTALMRAALKGRLEVLKELVARGADLHLKNPRNKTVLQLVENRKDRLPIKEILVRALNSARSPSIQPQRKKKSSRLRSSESVQELSVPMRLAKICGCEPETHSYSKGCLLFSVKRSRVSDIPKSYDRILKDNFESFREEQHYLVKTYGSDNGLRLCLVPTSDRLDVVKRLKTCGPKFGLSNKNLLKFLKSLSDEQDFEITECGARTLEMRFLKKVRAPVRLARAFCELSPTVVDEYGDDPRDVADHLKSKGTVALGWP